MPPGRARDPCLSVIKTGPNPAVAVGPVVAAQRLFNPLRPRRRTCSGLEPEARHWHAHPSASLLKPFLTRCLPADSVPVEIA